MLCGSEYVCMKSREQTLELVAMYGSTFDFRLVIVRLVETRPNMNEPDDRGDEAITESVRAWGGGGGGGVCGHKWKEIQ